MNSCSTSVSRVRCLGGGCKYVGQARMHGLLCAPQHAASIVDPHLLLPAQVLEDMDIFQSLTPANRSSIADCLTLEEYKVRPWWAAAASPHQPGWHHPLCVPDKLPCRLLWAWLASVPLKFCCAACQTFQQ